jgi:nucleoid-associated protein YgaU
MGIFNHSTQKTDKPDFGNVKSGSSSTDPSPQSTPTSIRTHTVQKGDTLSEIAKTYYGDANKWHKIYEANRDVIKNPDLIYPGQTFTIPDA